MVVGRKTVVIGDDCKHFSSFSCGKTAEIGQNCSPKTCDGWLIPAIAGLQIDGRIIWTVFIAKYLVFLS